MKINRILVLAMFFLLASRLLAVLIFTGEQIEFRIIDAVRYSVGDIVLLDIEIIGRGNPQAAGVFKVGRRFNIQMKAEQAGELKIGGHFSADLKAFFDDMGSGRISVSLDRKSLKILPVNAEQREIPPAFWEAALPFLPFFKLLFILSGWLLALVLCWRSEDKI